MALINSWSAHVPFSRMSLVHLYSIPLRLAAVSPSKKSKYRSGWLYTWRRVVVVVGCVRTQLWLETA